jgi:hypothetical protein
MGKFLVLIFILIGTFTISNAQPKAPDFYEQLKLIVALGEADKFKSIQGDYISTDADDGSKTYSFPLKLEGFNNTLIQGAKGRTVVAMGITGKSQYGTISSLMNVAMRSMNGMYDYTQSDYKAAHPEGLEIFESVTELIREGGTVKIQIYKVTSTKEYFMLIFPY